MTLRDFRWRTGTLTEAWAYRYAQAGSDRLYEPFVRLYEKSPIAGTATSVPIVRTGSFAVADRPNGNGFPALGTRATRVVEVDLNKGTARRVGR